MFMALFTTITNANFNDQDILQKVDKGIVLKKQLLQKAASININKGLRILVEEAMVPFDAALNSCTINPARVLRVDDRKGKLNAGYDADIVVLEDDYAVAQTYCKGIAML